MSKTLYLPEHVAQKMNKEREEAKADSSSLEGAYVDAKERVLDPSLLDKPLLERLPQPTGWRVLVMPVMPYEGQAKTASGLYIPDEVRERERVATVVAYVMKLGPLAYKDPDKFGPNPEPWCKEGQWVCIGRVILVPALRLMAAKFVLSMTMRSLLRSLSQMISNMFRG
jgi:co-chaperonin GroES (HSP10)